MVQIRGLYYDKAIPIERKATEGTPQNIFSRLFYDMLSSLHGRSRKSAQFLNCLSWFLAKTQQYCSVRDSCLPVLLQHPGDGKLSLRLYVLFQALSLPNYIFLASVWGPAGRSLTVPLRKLLFPTYTHTDLSGLAHWIREDSCLIFPITAAVSHAFTWVSQPFFVLLGPRCYNGWPTEQRLDNLCWLRAEERPWLSRYSSTGQEGTSSIFPFLHEWACNHHPQQQPSILSQYKLFHLGTARISGHFSCLQLAAPYNLPFIVLPL